MTENTTDTTNASRWIVIFTVLIVVVFTALFMFEFMVASQNSGEGAARVLSEDSYAEEVAALLANADAENGAALVEQYECHVCHIQGGGQVAPLFEGIADVAAERRPPLTAEAYLYEAIAYPSVHVVDGYPNSMVANYLNRLSEEEFGDILAYLLEQTTTQ